MSRETPTTQDMSAIEGPKSGDTASAAVPSWTGDTVVVVPAGKVETWIEDNAPAFVLYYR